MNFLATGLLATPAERHGFNQAHPRRYTVRPGSPVVAGQPPGLADRLGIGGLYLYAFAALFSTAAMNLGLGAMVLATVWRWRLFWETFSRRPVFWLTAAFGLYVTFRALMAGQEFPATQTLQFRAAQDLITVGGLPTLIIALWTGGNWARIRRLLVLAVAGFFILLLYKLGWATVLEPATGRMGLEMSPNTLGLITSTLLLGSLLFLLWRPSPHLDGSHSLLLQLGLGAIAILAGVSVVLTGSRGAWLASAVIMPPTLIAALWRVRPAGQRGRPLVTVLALLGLMVLLALWAGGDMLRQRISAASSASGSLLASGETSVTDESIGSRLLMWQDGTQHISERPVLGWGPGSAPMLLGQSAHLQIQKYPHFHNLPLTLWITLGAVGALLFLATQAAMILEAVHAYRDGRMAAELFFLALGGLGLFFVANFFQYRLSGTTSQYLLTLLGMIALSPLAAHAKRTGPATPPAGPQ